MKKIIISHHNFKNTPISIEKTLNKIKKLSPGIIKLITTAQSINDNFIILRTLKKTKEKAIMFCMGKKGILSRILCTNIGSYLTFATLHNKSSALGQLDIKLTKKFIKLTKLN